MVFVIKKHWVNTEVWVKGLCVSQPLVDETNRQTVTLGLCVVLNSKLRTDKMGKNYKLWKYEKNEVNYDAVLMT